jgi:8-oxo-dGTP diphosphatase
MHLTLFCCILHYTRLHIKSYLNGANDYNPVMRTKIPVTVHLLFCRENQILLLRRFNTGFEDGNYSVPAGHLDGDEPVRVAAQREALEEVGIHIDIKDIAFASVMHRKSDDTLLPLSGTGAGTGERVDFFVHIKAWNGEPSNAEPDKCDELRWCNVDALPKNTIPYVKQAIQNFREGIVFEEFGWSKINT